MTDAANFATTLARLLAGRVARRAPVLAALCFGMIAVGTAAQAQRRDDSYRPPAAQGGGAGGGG
ncbi:MAG: hypothetical protein ABL908_23100, partial [Hyphomicrobium sp.]